MKEQTQNELKEIFSKKLTLTSFFSMHYYLLLFILDIVVKYVACSYQITGYCLLNMGSSWGLFSNIPNYSSIIAVLSVVVLVLMFTYSTQLKILISGVSFNFFVAGILGNTLNRITQGGVIDILYLPYMQWFGIFNLADCFLVFGIIYFMYYEFTRIKAKKISN